MKQTASGKGTPLRIHHGMIVEMVSGPEEARFVGRMCTDVGSGCAEKPSHYTVTVIETVHATITVVFAAHCSPLHNVHLHVGHLRMPPRTTILDPGFSNLDPPLRAISSTCGADPIHVGRR